MKLQLLLIALVMFFAGCATGTDKPGGAPLVVGVSPHYKPIIFKHDGKVDGLEADFATRLAQDLDRPLQFKEYAWGDLFAALQAGEVDILMAGVSVTGKRATQVLFTEPYMAVGQMAMIRKDDAARLGPPGALYSGEFRVGYVNGTTGQEFVRNSLDGTGVGFDVEETAIQALIAGEIDYFVHDAPTVWELANSHDPSHGLMGLYKPLTREQLAWVVRKDNHALAAEANNVLLQWHQNGFLRDSIRKWVPVMISVER